MSNNRWNWEVSGFDRGNLRPSNRRQLRLGLHSSDGTLSLLRRLLAGTTHIAPVVNYWWPRLPSNLSQQAFSKQFLQDQWSLRVAHQSPSLTYWWNTQKWFPSLTLSLTALIFFPAKIENSSRYLQLAEQVLRHFLSYFSGYQANRTS
ncbi:hypothetical protein Hdeb2414_s0007g00260561 [Helianthus debilis subsp. tardiflorus]